MSNIRKLRSPKGNIRVALTSGHVITITEELRDVPEVFWAGAYSQGAVSGDMVGSTLTDKAAAKKLELEAEEFLQLTKLKEVLISLFNAPQGAIDKNGLPMIRKVSALVGSTVNKPEMLTLWEELKETEG